MPRLKNILNGLLSRRRRRDATDVSSSHGKALPPAPSFSPNRCELCDVLFPRGKHLVQPLVTAGMSIRACAKCALEELRIVHGRDFYYGSSVNKRRYADTLVFLIKKRSYEQAIKDKDGNVRKDKTDTCSPKL